jgi:hypothetical protein
MAKGAVQQNLHPRGKGGSDAWGAEKYDQELTETVFGYNPTMHTQPSFYKFKCQDWRCCTKENDKLNVLF